MCARALGGWGIGAAAVGVDAGGGRAAGGPQLTSSEGQCGGVFRCPGVGGRGGKRDVRGKGVCGIGGLGAHGSEEGCGRRSELVAWQGR